MWLIEDGRLRMVDFRLKGKGGKAAAKRFRTSNKCFIHSPAGVIAKIIVFWFYWQQDFECGFIEAGLLIKQRCTKPPIILAHKLLYG